MAEFVLSAFADEYSPKFDEQLEGLKKNGVGFIEIRGVDGTNVADLTDEQLHEVRAKLERGWDRRFVHRLADRKDQGV